MSSERIAVLGAGGHAMVVVATLQACGRNVVAVYDDAEQRWGGDVLGVPVVGPVDAVRSSDCTHGVIGIGDNRVRERISRAVDIEWTTVVHPMTWIHPAVPIGGGTVVFAGAIVQPGAEIGMHVILNTKASLDHECRVGDFAHIAHSQIGGGVVLGDGAFVALGASVLPWRKVGAWAIVGAGAVVTKDVAAGATVIGIPARAR